MQNIYQPQGSHPSQYTSIRSSCFHTNPSLLKNLHILFFFFFVIVSLLFFTPFCSQRRDWLRFCSPHPAPLPPCARCCRIKDVLVPAVPRSALENAAKENACARSPVWTLRRTRRFRRSFAVRGRRDGGPACRADATGGPAPTTGSRKPGLRYPATAIF